MCCFNPLDKFYKNYLGAVPSDFELILRVKGNFDSCILLVKNDKEIEDLRIKMDKKKGYFECKLNLNIGLYFYCFDIGNGKFIGLNRQYLGEITFKPTRFQLSIYNKNFNVPKWLNGGVIYQIFPDRFNRFEKEKHVEDGKLLHSSWDEQPLFLPNENGKVLNNDFFGGDFKGIIEKLPYLSDLGVTAIYLNPIFKAYSNHRYDTGDYFKIDPLLGTEDDFIELINSANEYNIKIILDGVFNHTGDDSVYFNKYNNYDCLGAYQSQNSPYFAWYDFENYPNEYKSWWGITVLPAIKKDCDSFIDFIAGDNGVLDYYTKLGVGGWRLDVVDELSSKFVKNIRKAVKNANKNAIIIGEVWEDASNKIAYSNRREYFLGGELDSVMNYPLKDAIISFILNGNSEELSFIIKEQLDHYPTIVVNSLMNILSTHDTARLLSVFGNYDKTNLTKLEMSKIKLGHLEKDIAKNKVKIASLLQFTLFGVPSIYYGDEVGLEGLFDPMNRQTFPWDNIDNELLKWYKFLGKLRQDFSSLKSGEYQEIYSSNGSFVFKRFDENNELLIAVSTNKPLNLRFDGILYDLASNTNFEKEIVLNEFNCAVLIKKRDI